MSTTGPADELCLRVEVPVCAFRPYASREYQDTHPIPTPSAVYGMLLSLVGVKRENKHQHRGANLALAIDRLPGRSKVFRKLRRGNGQAGEKGCRPDYQDLLLDLGLWVWVAKGKETTDPCLAERVRTGLAKPATITRSGGLSLGESSYLVDVVKVAQPPESALFIVPHPKGFYSLPTWVDHDNHTKTVLNRFHVGSILEPVEARLPSAWFIIGE